MGLSDESDPRTVFISSTSQDLKKFREVALSAARNLHLDRIVMEDFDAGAPLKPLHECLRQVREKADVLVVIVAKRYGWIPSENWPGLPANQKEKSITWLECLEAQSKRIRVIPLVLGETSEWPEEFVDQRHASELERFRAWIDHHYVAKRFHSTDDFRDELTRALDSWKNGRDWSEDPAEYFDWIARKAARTLSAPGQASTRQAYVPLKAHQPGKDKDLSGFVMTTRYLLVTAGPGSGKSSFLANYACDLARSYGKAEGSRFPVLLPASEFWEHVSSYRQRYDRGSPTASDSPFWVSHFLATESVQRGWALSGGCFEALLKRGDCAILIDGLDQADRREMGLWIEELKDRYPQCQIVVTSRPWAVVETRGIEQFTRVSIANLDNAGIKKFLLAWNTATLNTAAMARPDQAQRQANALHRALLRRPMLRHFARTPLLLSIIAAECRTPQDLPASRSVIYEKIMARLLAAGEPPNYEPAEVLQELAWSMQSSRSTKTEVTARWAGEEVIRMMPGSTILTAAKNLERLSARTGILSEENGRLRFWHPTMREFLAARRLLYTPRRERLRILAEELGERLVSESWQQILFFLGEMLEAEPDDIHALIEHLIESHRKAQSGDTRMRYAAAILALKRELRGFPEECSGAYTEILEAVRADFMSGNLQGVDLSARIEIAGVLASDPTDGPMAWVFIDGGELWMGAQKKDRAQPRYDQDAFPSESPVRRVTIAGYHIGKFPVTVAQYAAFVRAEGYQQRKFWPVGAFGKWSEPLRWDEQLDSGNNPVTGVSWHEASAYCSWKGCRLPAEAEWERAAAGPEGRRFPWGDQVPEAPCANYGRRFGGVTPVGLFPEYASAEQVNDLAGNVWEWVADDFSEGRKTLRGGCYQNDRRFLRTTERIGARPGERYTNFGPAGFRCARSA